MAAYTVLAEHHAVKTIRNLKYGGKDRQTSGTKQLHKNVLVVQFFRLVCSTDN